eukprot:TRINITY_DN13958_c0_g1_i3.p1 TRINITY_DN13958_c0_g1~~TRINITY_DN13958_c0_g1_i3.p1  ORF type:complete len:623 (-),score=81.01 TRINITY_DN13958_c0_g1_i3:88-1956(-)
MQSILPAWSLDEGHALPGCTAMDLSCETRNPSSSQQKSRSEASSHRSAMLVDETLAKMTGDLEIMMKSLCDNVQEAFGHELRSRLKTLRDELLPCAANREQAPDGYPLVVADTYVDVSETSADAGAPVDDSVLGALAGSCCEKRPPSHGELVERAKPTVQQMSQLPIICKSELQIATMTHDIEKGRLQAHRAVLAAGFLGGAGPMMQGFWLVWGIAFTTLALATSGSTPFYIGECGLGCTFLFYLYKVRTILMGFSFFAQSFSLRRGNHDHAHAALVMLTGIWASFSSVICVASINLTSEDGCSWRSADYLLHAAGSSCPALSLLDSLAWLAMQVPVAGMTWTLMRMQLKEASHLLLVCAWGMASILFVYSAVGFYYDRDSLSKSRPAVVLTAVAISVPPSVVTVRHFSRRRAWKKVEADVKAYDREWAGIAARQGESLQQLSKTSHDIVMEIVTAGREGPQRHLGHAENQRRALLQHFHPGATLQQSLCSLQLLYAQATAVDGLFQAKCAEWAMDAGKHVAGRIKQPSRAIQKMWRDYHGNAQCLVDLVRASIVCERPGDVLAVLTRILADSTAKIVRIKNRFDPHFDSKLSGGYRNLSLNLIVHDDDTVNVCAERHICEL